MARTMIAPGVWRDDGPSSARVQPGMRYRTLGGAIVTGHKAPISVAVPTSAARARMQYRNALARAATAAARGKA